MKAKIIAVKDKTENQTVGHYAENQFGEMLIGYGVLSIITDDGLILRTSKIQKITVETRNSIYELEIV